MLLETAVGAEVAHMPAPCDQRVGDQAPMAANPPRLGAHHRRPLLLREHLELRQSACELVAGHVVRVATELVALPGAVRRIRQRLSATSERLAEPAVADSCLQQDRRQRGALEVWLAAGAGGAADVCDQLDAGASDQLEELPLLVVGVADGEDLSFRPHPEILPPGGPCEVL